MGGCFTSKVPSEGPSEDPGKVPSEGPSKSPSEIPSEGRCLEPLLRYILSNNMPPEALALVTFSGVGGCFMKLHIWGDF